MRLTRFPKAFDHPDYIFELKHDGFRAIAYIENGNCKLVSRNSNQFKSFTSLKDALGKLRVESAIMDGEVICIDRNGVSQFNALFSRKGRPVFYAFDLLWHDGEDLRKVPLIERKKRLRELVLNSGCNELIYAQHIETQGVAFFRRNLPAGLGRDCCETSAQRLQK